MDRMLDIKSLKVSYRKAGEKTGILRGVNLCAGENESVALVGESGSGKTVTARAVMRLLPANMRVESGGIFLRGTDIMKLGEKELRDMRGSLAGMIFQEPSSYLNPVFTAGSQVSEAVKDSSTAAAKKERALKMLRDVGLDGNAYYQYPHQLSGGMQQRVMIAMALINGPAMLIADEPTTALDVTTAGGIIELLKNIQASRGLSVLFITHDISLAVSFTGRVAVMYAGRIVEFSTAAGIMENPLHPYTEKLVSCLPEKYKAGDKIQVIAGSVPDFRELPAGCPFHPRCESRMEICALKEPGETRQETATVRCFRYGNAMETE